MATRGPSRRLAIAAGALWVGSLTRPPEAVAHLVTTGLGPFYDGMSHLFLTPQDLLPLLAVALWAGLRGPDRSRPVLFLLPLAWMAGGLFGLLRPDEVSWPLVTSVSVLVGGTLVALDRGASARGVTAIALIVGVVHGYLNGTAMSAAGLGFQGLLGIAVAAFVLVALASALAVTLREGWTRIAVRVAGSWIVATGLFMVGWTLR